MTNPAVKTINSNFELKNQSVDLIPRRGAIQFDALSLVQLEAIRTSRPAVTASKNGLETICGASCETGAQ